MREVRWNLKKSEWLRQTRGASFEEIIQGELIRVLKHPKKANQRVLLVEFGPYIWVIPFVETKNTIFLKTAYPSRKFTKVYKRGGLS